MTTLHLLLWVVVLYIWVRIFQKAMAGYGWLLPACIVLAVAVVQIAYLLAQLTND